MVRLPLGQNGLAWVRESLTHGRALSKALLATRPIVGGSCFALVPRGLSLMDLRQGGNVSRAAAKAELAHFLNEQVRARPNATLVVEDELASDTDPSEGRHASWAADGEGGIFYWMELRSGNVAKAPNCLEMSSSAFPTNAFLFSGGIEHLGVLESNRLCDVHKLRHAFQAILRAVITSAFDAESWVIWIPPD